jgi:hypothetical protein
MLTLLDCLESYILVSFQDFTKQYETTEHPKRNRTEQVGFE